MMDRKNNKVVVFGGSGFLGTALIERLISKGHTNILSVSRNEGLAVSLKEKFPNVSIMIGDISNKWDVKRAMKGAHQCFLLSAMKHVGLSESQVQSCINTNLIGTMNVINESLIVKPKFLVFISSDKAANPNGVYGCSKKIGERLMVEAEKSNHETKYVVVRYGNVAWSTSSVLCKWKDKMQSGQEVIVTDENATRFFWSASESLDLIFDAVNSSGGAQPIVPLMKSIKIGDLLEVMMGEYGRVPVKKIGLGPGENMHEIIAEGHPDSFHSERFTLEEIKKLIRA